MMKAKWCIAALAMGFAGMAFADVSSVMTIDLQGPGGHSYRRYGNTNAVHAAARAISAIQTAIPDQRQCVVFNFNGGATVNAIASNSSFQVSLVAKDQKAMDELKAKVQKAVKEGVDAENKFRSAKPGDLTQDGVPAAISVTIK